MTIQSPATCQVDGCERRVAASVVVRKDLPGPIQLCATHTEDFRMNGAAWTVTWTAGESGPTSVRAAPAAPVGRTSMDTPKATAERIPGWAKWKARLSGRRESGS